MCVGLTDLANRCYGWALETWAVVGRSLGVWESESTQPQTQPSPGFSLNFVRILMWLCEICNFLALETCLLQSVLFSV